jgi:uncharacterized protein with PhoU and TrkA domain
MKSEEGLLELKEKTELMVDLAYSAIIYDNIELAKEVYELEDFIDKKNREIQRAIMEEVERKEIRIGKGLILSRLARSTELIADGALELADVELRDVELHPIIKESIHESDTTFARITINKSSILAGKRLAELQLASMTGMTVIALRREKEWICGPKGDLQIEKGDVLLAKGPAEAEKDFIKLAKGRKRKI